MFKSSSDGIFEYGQSGVVVDKTMEEIDKNSKKESSIFDMPVVAIVVALICAISDGVFLSKPLSLVSYDSPLLIWLGTSAMLIAFDVGPLFLGNALKKRSQGLNASLVEVGMFVIAFIVALVLNICLRLELRYVIVPDTLLPEAENISLLYAWFTALLPIVTSFVSFGISFETSNPLKKKISMMEHDVIHLEDCVAETESILKEYEEDENYFERMLEEDEELYNAKLVQIEELAAYYSDYVKERIKEHLGDAAANNELSKSNRAVLIKMVGNSEKEESA